MRRAPDKWARSRNIELSWRCRPSMCRNRDAKLLRHNLSRNLVMFGFSSEGICHENSASTATCSTI